MTRLMADQRYECYVRAARGESYNAIATALGCDRLTVAYYHKHYHDEATTEDRPRKGRPRATSAKTDKAMVRMALRSEKASTCKIAKQVHTAHGGAPGHSTVHRRLREQGIRWASGARSQR